MKRSMVAGSILVAFVLFYAFPCFSATYDATGTWKSTSSNNWSSSGCPKDDDGTSLVFINQNGNSFTVNVDEGTRSGTVSGSVYTETSTWPDEGGTVSETVTITLSSSSYGTGSKTWTWSDGSTTCHGGSNMTITKQSGASTVTGNLLTSDLWIGAVINTVEKGPIEAVWKKGGEATTAAGDRVIWGHFYASPTDVTWGSENNPDLYVKIWFDHSGRTDVNFFHVSVPDIEVYSEYPYDGTPDEHGIATMNFRYIRQYYENGQHHSEVH